MVTTQPRNIIRFIDSDIAKQVIFSPHEDSLLYERWLDGKVGTIKKIKNSLFDQQITVDFNYLLQFSPTPNIRSSVFKTSDRDSVIKSIVGRKITFCHEKSKWNTERNVPVNGMFLSEIGGREYDFVEENVVGGSIYFGLNTPTTEVKFVNSYYQSSPIGPEFTISGNNLIFK